MSIPKHFEIRVPALKLLEKCDTPLKAKDLEKELVLIFKLSNLEQEERYASENQKESIFLNRINWALSYMNLTGLLAKPTLHRLKRIQIISFLSVLYVILVVVWKYLSLPRLLRTSLNGTP
jgi:restriction endonuclease Mrr